ncbi:endo-1,4-beta-xylanase [Seonamhaeicola sp.]|uniref:endo-1,4-beta-xylanase n=1 Tax=Seonamhaeicola sp. TaxID=1912245 RepID=UPI00260992AE|nr:endo-1,4-beta-xylanase [Seonamhaeicola sp.]
MRYLKIKTLAILVCLLNVLNCKENKPNTVNSQKIVSLKNRFEANFFIEAAINKGIIEGKDSLSLSLIKKEYNTITPENDLKWEQIHPKKDTFYFDIADKYVAFGEKIDANIVGHTLVWHSQLAPWMHEDMDSLEMFSHIKNHINTIVSRYKGRIDTWDVVNEALNEDGSLRASLFLKTIGETYIEQAFKLAAEADPEALLVYNDYNLWKPKKRAGVVRLVKQLQSKGIKIDGVGLQAHYSLLGPTIEDIENSIIAFSELGIKVMITELDVTALPNPWDLNGAAVEQSYERFEGDPKMNPYPVKLTDSAQINPTLSTDKILSFSPKKF